MNAVKDVSLKYGLKINTKKAKIMVARRDIDGGSTVKTLKQVKKYQYQLQLITEDGRSEVHIKRRIEIARTY